MRAHDFDIPAQCERAGFMIGFRSGKRHVQAFGVFRQPAHARNGNQDGYELRAIPGLDFEQALLRHEAAGVRRQIHDDLLDLRRIRHDCRQMGVFGELGWNGGGEDFAQNTLGPFQ
jgi:hypothetical protein